MEVLKRAEKQRQKSEKGRENYSGRALSLTVTLMRRNRNNISYCPISAPHRQEKTGQEKRLPELISRKILENFL